MRTAAVCAVVVSLIAASCRNAASTSPVPSLPVSVTPSHNPQVWKDRYPDAKIFGDDPIYLLVIGSDGRSYDPVRCFTNGARADAIHLVAVDPVGKGVAIINIPRDTWVDIPRHGNDKINAALAIGGPDLLTETVRELTGIPVYHYAVTTFCGLIKMVEAIGGIEINVPRTFTDPAAGFGLPGYCQRVQSLAQGRQVLNGCEVLYLARNRHEVAGSDFGRTTNQARILIAGLRKFREMARTPSGMLDALRILTENVEFSFRCENLYLVLPCRDIIALANLARTLNPSAIVNCTLPGYGDWVGDASIVRLRPSALQIFADVKNDGIIDDPSRCYASS